MDVARHIVDRAAAAKRLVMTRLNCSRGKWANGVFMMVLMVVSGRPSGYSGVEIAKKPSHQLTESSIILVYWLIARDCISRNASPVTAYSGWKVHHPDAGPAWLPVNNWSRVLTQLVTYSPLIAKHSLSIPPAA